MIREYIIKISDEIMEEEIADRPQELVRCKDCEHCYFASNRVPDDQAYACGKRGFDVTPDWYCADGERRCDDG